MLGTLSEHTSRGEEVKPMGRKPKRKRHRRVSPDNRPVWLLAASTVAGLILDVIRLLGR
jgi:hypothetical protein